MRRKQEKTSQIFRRLAPQNDKSYESQNRMSVVKKTVAIMILLAGFALGSDLVSRIEFENQHQKNQAEFKSISVSLAEIKTELVHLNQDMAELKELRRSILDRLIDMFLAGGLAFSGSLAWRTRRNGKRQEG